MKVPATALFPLATPPERIAPVLEVELNENTYTPKASEPQSDWVTRAASPAFVAVRERHPETAVRDFCSIGTGAGLDALGAVEVFDPATVTDLDTQVVDLAVRNIRTNGPDQLAVTGHT